LLAKVSSFLLVDFIVADMKGALFAGSKDVLMMEPVRTVELIESGKAFSMGSYLVILYTGFTDDLFLGKLL
jgi:hypothetical protein